MKRLEITKPMRVMVREMQTILKAYEEGDKAYDSARNVKEYLDAKAAREYAAKDLEAKMLDMVRELNGLLSIADAIGNREYYKMEIHTI